MNTPTISDESIANLEYIVKSHACTQVGFDKYSLEDYPKMIEAILQWHKRLLADFAERITPEGCSWCDFKGHTETGGMAMEDDLVEKEPCEYCSEIRDEITKRTKEYLKRQPTTDKIKEGTKSND